MAAVAWLAAASGLKSDSQARRRATASTMLKTTAARSSERVSEGSIAWTSYSGV